MNKQEQSKVNPDGSISYDQLSIEQLLQLRKDLMQMTISPLGKVSTKELEEYENYMMTGRSLIPVPQEVVLLRKKLIETIEEEA